MDSCTECGKPLDPPTGETIGERLDRLLKADHDRLLLAMCEALEVPPDKPRVPGRGGTGEASVSTVSLSTVAVESVDRPAERVR